MMEQVEMEELFCNRKAAGDLEQHTVPKTASSMQFAAFHGCLHNWCMSLCINGYTCEMSSGGVR